MKTQHMIGKREKRERGSVSAELALFLAAIIIPSVQFLSNGALVDFIKEVPQKESSAMMAVHSTPLNLGINFDLLINPQPSQSFLLPTFNGATPLDELDRLAAIAEGNSDPAGQNRCLSTLELVRVNQGDFVNNEIFSKPICDTHSLAQCRTIALQLFQQEIAPAYSVYLCSWTDAQSLPANPMVTKVLIDA